ncbi:hypothetical protein KIP69_04495 [Geobacter sulfurreducens]|jgi:protein CpxP|uniref:CpxP superfamily protein n=1 Tax=Geobacter sulfurreducens (strain ATCC 51573 / DSM 12127 / PCA) TaxID=243231 RepID=I7F9G4_GEOSL|nr:hypothetical protein [Geobacter sulfurreducens]ADI83719.1 hypothetical protein KN400_0856 [Geobacter sulfurreducens KN400]AFP20414.1 hypothetical protein GSU3511 [Geobacter sulfurreducens PCA]AJY70614.1 hypothetical protein RW64_14020 [Geobacter sulfurreducens]QVW36118.1 hypothetical protein KIP69_04495 [Geobacter sulfurreducens]UAC04932.1 hypothetical protein KVP06_04405 [Geobacter sulfurreducens]
MRRRIKLALAALTAVAALAGTQQAVLAQTDPAPGAGMGKVRGGGGVKKMDPAERLKRMERHLGLTEEQKTAIAPILAEENGEMKAVRDDASLNRTQKREKMREIRDRYHDRIGAILTPEQRQKADEARDRARDRWEKRQQRAKDRQN